MRDFLRYYLPALLWGMMIALFSMGFFGGDITERILADAAHSVEPGISRRALSGVNTAVRKSAHIFEYGVFALLLWRAMRREAAERWRLRWAVTTAALSVALAAGDELHQFYTRGRAGSVVDVGWDALGAALALAWIYWRARKARAASTD